MSNVLLTPGVRIVISTALSLGSNMPCFVAENCAALSLIFRLAAGLH